MSLLFSPASLSRMKLRNRLIMSPMQQYQGTPESFATAYHVHHYARRARGGVGLVIVESTAVSPNGRLYPDDIGIFTDAHVPPLAAITQAVHSEGAAIALQLCHGGRKSHPSVRGRVLAPSAIAYDDFYGTPEAMVLTDIEEAVSAFADAARRAVIAGFDAIEIHAAHGYLIHQFLSPLTNRRSDAYGGSPENRARFLVEVFAAVRAAVGPGYPVIVRVSATDFAEDGLTPEAVSDALRGLVPLGLDAVDVSAGALLPLVPEGIGPEYQVPYSEAIRRSLGVPTIAVGLIRNGVRAERILAEGRADFIAIGRPFLEAPDYSDNLRNQIEALASRDQAA